MYHALGLTHEVPQTLIAVCRLTFTEKIRLFVSSRFLLSHFLSGDVQNDPDDDPLVDRFLLGLTLPS